MQQAGWTVAAPVSSHQPLQLHNANATIQFRDQPIDIILLMGGSVGGYIRIYLFASSLKEDKHLHPHLKYKIKYLHPQCKIW